MRMKRFIAMLLVFCMVLGNIPVYAAEEGGDGQSMVFALGESVTLTKNEAKAGVTYSFTPEEDGFYLLRYARNEDDVSLMLNISSDEGTVYDSPHQEGDYWYWGAELIGGKTYSYQITNSSWWGDSQSTELCMLAASDITEGIKANVDVVEGFAGGASTLQVTPKNATAMDYWTYKAVSSDVGVVEIKVAQSDGTYGGHFDLHFTGVGQTTITVTVAKREAPENVLATLSVPVSVEAPEVLNFGTNYISLASGESMVYMLKASEGKL